MDEHNQRNHDKEKEQKKPCLKQPHTFAHLCSPLLSSLAFFLLLLCAFAFSPSFSSLSLRVPLKIASLSGGAGCWRGQQREAGHLLPLSSYVSEPRASAFYICFCFSFSQLRVLVYCGHCLASENGGASVNRSATEGEGQGGG